MKKNLLYTILLAGGLLTFAVSCEDNKKEFLDDFSTILGFRNNGEQKLTLYRTGENFTTKAVVNKGGSNLKTTTKASISVLDASQLEIYNTENHTSYKMLPASCYEILGNTSFDFSRDDLYKTLDIELKTDEIYQLTGENIHVLPLALSSPTDSVNSINNIVLFNPTVLIPKLFFEQTGYVRSSFEDGGETEKNFELGISLPTENKWNFTCTVEIDEALVNEYNAKNGLNYSVLPEEDYQLSGDGVVTFTPENKLTSKLDIKVSSQSLKYGNYVLPIRLVDSSKEEFEIDEDKNTCLYGISYVPEASALQPITLKTDMLTSNAVEPSEGSLANLLDGDKTTYFHSAWSVAVDGDHYLQVNLEKPITAFSFTYTGRSSGSAGNPANIILMGSMDGVEYFKIDQIADGLPTATAGVYSSPVFVSPEFKHLRIVVTKNQSGGAYFVFSEFGMKGI